MPKQSSKLMMLIGVLLVLISVFVNLKILGALVAQDGTIDNFVIIHNFWIFRLVLFFAGIILIANQFYFSKLLLFKKELLLLFVVILLCLLLLEFVSSYVVKYNYTHWSFRNKVMHYKNLEYNITAKFNSYGFRDDEFNTSKNFRVAIVGDSFVFGDGVEKNQTFEYLLAQKLLKQGKDVAVYNLGVSGASPEEYLTVIKEFAPILKPNVTIVSLYLENDFVCSSDKFKWFFPNLRQVIRKSYEGRSAKSDVGLLLQNTKLPEKYKNYLSEKLISQYVISYSIHHPNVTENYLRNVEWFNSCGINRQILLQLEQYVESQNSKLLFVLIPPNYQVGSANWKTLEELGYQFDYSLLSNRESQQDILDFCIKEKIQCLDLLPYLKSISKFPFFKIDIHFNPVGHALAAETIFEYLGNSALTK